MINQDSVRIIIVTFNGIEYIDTCLKSCDKYQTIVVDNASTDSTVSFIREKYPNVKILEQTENLGFGQANNLGISDALKQGAEHVFLLNQDAYLVDDVLEQLCEFQNLNPEYGLLSPVHVKLDKKRLDKSFSNYMLKENTGQFYSDFVLGNKISSVYHVPFVNAAAWLLSKTCLETVGGFDSLFFHYGEDNNYCQRVLFHNLKIGVLPNAYIIHDRIDRGKTKIIQFSDKYYNSKELNYKINHADITKPFNIEKDIDNLKTKVIQLQLKFKFKKARAFKKEIALLQSLLPKIEQSRQINVKVGPSHLFEI